MLKIGPVLLLLLMAGGCAPPVTFSSLTRITPGPTKKYYAGITKPEDKDFYIPEKELRASQIGMNQLVSYYVASYDRKGRLLTLSRYMKTDYGPQMIGSARYFYGHKDTMVRILIREMLENGYVINYDELYDANGKMLVRRELDNFGNPVTPGPEETEE